MSSNQTHHNGTRAFANGDEPLEPLNSCKHLQSKVSSSSEQVACLSKAAESKAGDLAEEFLARDTLLQV